MVPPVTGRCSAADSDLKLIHGCCLPHYFTQTVPLGCEITQFPLKVEESLTSSAKKGKASLASCLLDMEIQLPKSTTALIAVKLQKQVATLNQFYFNPLGLDFSLLCPIQGLLSIKSQRYLLYDVVEDNLLQDRRLLIFCWNLLWTSVQQVFSWAILLLQYFFPLEVQNWQEMCCCF